MRAAVPTFLRLALVMLALASAGCARPYRAPGPGDPYATIHLNAEVPPKEILRFEFEVFDLGAACPVGTSRFHPAYRGRVPLERRQTTLVIPANTNLLLAITHNRSVDRCLLRVWFPTDAGGVYDLDYTNDGRRCQLVGHDRGSGAPLAMRAEGDCIGFPSGVDL